MKRLPPLVDSFGRRHNNLRVSVTDRCNIRCFYCMPEEDVEFVERHKILSFEEITRFVQVAAAMGVNKLRITGGEPLVRAQLPELIRRLAAIDGITDVALTTNGILLADQAEALREAGLKRVNISLDTLDEATFLRLTRRQGLHRVLSGIDAAMACGFEQIRLNAVAIRSITDREIIPLAEFARTRQLELRFIEFMPLDADNAWERDHVLSGDEIRAALQQTFGELVPAERPDASQPAMDFDYADGLGRVGFINPVSQPFCQDCNRIRLTAEGQIRNCLFSTEEWDVRELLRAGEDDRALAALIRNAVLQKKPGHGIETVDFEKPARAMYQIGG